MMLCCKMQRKRCRVFFEKCIFIGNICRNKVNLDRTTAECILLFRPSTVYWLKYGSVSVLSFAALGTGEM